jgi:hypothetical protein
MKQPPSIMDRIQEQLTPPLEAAKMKALDLFLEIRESIGDAKARWVFAQWGTPPSTRRLNNIESMAIIDRLDMMKPEPNLKELARQIAQETIANPTQTEIDTIERYIQRLNAKRKQNRFWPQQRG